MTHPDEGATAGKHRKESERLMMARAAMDIAERSSPDHATGLTHVASPVPVERRVFLYPPANGLPASDEMSAPSETQQEQMAAQMSRASQEVSDALRACGAAHGIDLGSGSASAGLRYIDARDGIPPDLAPFVQAEARRHWSAYRSLQAKQTEAVARAVREVSGREASNPDDRSRPAPERLADSVVRSGAGNTILDAAPDDAKTPGSGKVRRPGQDHREGDDHER